MSLATLYVADPKAANVYAYDLSKNDWDGLSAYGQRKVLTNMVVRGLAVDGQGNLFFSWGDKGDVCMLTTSYLAKVAHAAYHGLDMPVQEIVTLYAAGATGNGGASVAQPAGLASDNFFVYWANTEGDASSGTLVKAYDSVGDKTVGGMEAVAANTEFYSAVASNVCLARDNVFFTGDTKSLYAVKTSGGMIAEVMSNFTQPHGCVYDEQGTLYVADGGADAVYSSAANFAGLRTVSYSTKVFEVPGVDQVAIFGAA